MNFSDVGSSADHGHGRARSGTTRALPDLVKVATTMITQINGRDAFLPQVISEDPQWLIILNLFIAAETGARLCVSDLCNISGVPPTTALRHIRALEREGLIVRSGDPEDARVKYLALHETSHRRVASYLLAIAPAWVAVNDDPAPAAMRVAGGGGR